MEAYWRCMVLLILMVIAQDTVAVSLSLCSNQNTADDSATYSQFQTNGLCADTCGSDYAFAITQGSNCWCSNYAPAQTTTTSACDQKCPGYPYEYCGGTDGEFGYIALNKEPAGTISGSSPTSQQTSQAAHTGKSSTPTGTSAGSSTADGATETVTRSPVTSIVTLPGQTQVSTIIITPSATSTSDTSPLGQGASINPTGNGLSKGAVAGLAVGVALGVSIIAGILVFFLWRRMRRQREEAETDSNPEMAIGGMVGTPSSMSRHTSTMSQSGLLNKAPKINTRNFSSNWSSQGHSAASTVSPTGPSNRRSLGADHRLDPHHAIYTNEELRHSDVSLQDNTDYSHKILSVRNRADGEVDDD